jgi:PBSX family phage terminase large subunit
LESSLLQNLQASLEWRAQAKNKLTFRGSAKAIQGCRAPEWIISGPSETGKTVAALHLLDQLARQYKDSQWAIIRKTRKDMDGSVLKRYRTSFEKNGVTAYGGQKPEWFDYPNGARIWIGGLDSPGKVLSSEKDGIYVNQAEELTLDDWETLTTRTTGRAGNVDFGGMTFGDANPGPPSHWIKQRPTLKLFESRHQDNPTLYDDAGAITPQGRRTMAVLDALTGVRRDRLRDGRWVQAEGTVYDFDAAVHLVDSFPVPEECRRIRVVDFGFTNPFVCLWLAIDPDGRIYLYREIYMTHRTVRVHAERIKQLSAGERIERTITDHDAEDRATLEENGIATEPAVKDVSPGIQAVAERLKLAGDGRPRLYVVRGALVEPDPALTANRQPASTEQEFDVYSWPKSVDGRPVKDAPVKLFDHGMDALRYGVMYVDGPKPAPAVTFQLSYAR